MPVFRYPITDRPTRDEAYHRVPMRGATHLFRWLERERPDILHVHSIKTGVGLPEFREARNLGIRIIATCHLPSLGYLCRTGELMQDGARPCDGVVDTAKCAGVQPHARRPAAAAVTRGRSDSTVARRAVAHRPGQGGHRHGHERSGRRVPEHAAGTVRTSSNGSWCSIRRPIGCLSPTDRRSTSSRSTALASVKAACGASQGPTIDRRRHQCDSVSQGACIRPRAWSRSCAPHVPYRATSISGSTSVRPCSQAGARAMEADLRRLAGDDSRIHFEPAVSSRDIPAVLADLTCRDRHRCGSRTDQRSRPRRWRSARRSSRLG